MTASTSTATTMPPSQPPEPPTPPMPPAPNARTVLRRLYTSHTLNTWNSRTFEFAAVLFLASLFPHTLRYASAYALFRAGAAAALASWVGAWVDRCDRLRCVRASVVVQRGCVAAGCVVFAAMHGVVKSGEEEEGLGGWVAVGFVGAVGLAGVEKLAGVANLVAVERDWVIVVAEELSVEREDLNATMRRIDLTAKLLAPLFISLVDEYSSIVAIWVVFAQNALSVFIEYFAIAQVHQAVPGLGSSKRDGQGASVDMAPSPEDQESQPSTETPLLSQRRSAGFEKLIQPWVAYVENPAFLASFSLSLLYFTVLSTGVQMQTYLFTLGFTAIEVSLMRFAAVIIELLATWAAPILMKKIGPIRSGLWFINEQLACVMASVALYLAAPAGTKTAGSSLICGVTFSRLGLWGFDLSAQYLIQQDTPETSRGKFSAAEMALQNIFELLSFGTTVIFARPEDFQYPILISAAAVAVSACCFASFVRKRRGHLLHASKCLKREKYTAIAQMDPSDVEAQHDNGRS